MDPVVVAIVVVLVLWPLSILLAVRLERRRGLHDEAPASWCPRCNGTGAEPGLAPTRSCDRCAGTGVEPTG